MEVNICSVKPLERVLVSVVLVVVLAQHHLDGQLREGDGVTAVGVVVCATVAYTVPCSQYVPVMCLVSTVRLQSVLLQCYIWLRQMINYR